MVDDGDSGTLNFALNFPLLFKVDLGKLIISLGFSISSIVLCRHAYLNSSNERQV